MLIIFFDSPGVMHKEFVPEGKIVMLLFSAVGEYFKIAVFWNVGRFVSRRAYDVSDERIFLTPEKRVI
jgi:hypothetical protein